MSSRLTAIDLFCGCGGLSLGLRRAKFKVIAAVDNDDLSSKTYQQNHRQTRVVQQDIRLVSPWNLMKELQIGPGELDLLAGCPPCQGFSTLRTKNGGLEVNEPMNDLVFEFIRFVRAFRPKAIMLENVPALHKDLRLYKIFGELSELGYESQAKVLNAENYGVPQRRHRMILIGSRFGLPAFAPIVRGRRTVTGAIGRLPLPEATEDPAHNYTVRRADHVLSLIQKIPKDGGSRTDLPNVDQLKCHQNFDGFKDVYGRMAWRKPAPTITSGCINPSKGRFIHPDADRAITLREAAILQGFPKSYKFDMSKGRYATALMIGNAFPPKFAEHHARSICEHLRKQIM